MKGLRGELDRLYATHGKLTPQIVLTAAKSEKSPLHMEFDWDDAGAAQSWRLQQAADLIKRVKVRYTDKDGAEQHVRAYVSLPSETGPGRTYEPVQKVVENEFSRRLLLAEMERDWLTFKRRYDRFEEFSALILADLSAEQATA